MATTLAPTQAAESKYETFAQEQLARAQRRIRVLDCTAALFGLMLVALSYVLLIVVCDRAFELPAIARFAAWWGFVAVAVGYASLTLILPALRDVNPYYAAKQLESTLPGAKNSVINWLDLRQAQLPQVVRAALSHRAAVDLTKAEPEHAISGRRTAWLGGAVFALLLAQVVAFFVIQPSQYLSLLGRAMFPFSLRGIASRTELALLRPQGGDVTVPLNQGITITVLVTGRVPVPTKPDALRLQFRYKQDEPYQERLLERGDGDQEWEIKVPGFEVHNGFWYRVVGGDAQTPEYHVQVRSAPLITQFGVTYHYRPYLRAADRQTADPNLEDFIGTEVTLIAHTNRTIKDGRLEGALDKPVKSEPVADDPRALRFRFPLAKTSTYRIWFTTTDGEANRDPSPYSIKVLADLAPRVDLKQPEPDHIPSNGTLSLAGAASDDFGLTKLVLKLKVMDVNREIQLKDVVYREGKSFQLDDGTYPRQLDYQDLVALDKVIGHDGQPVALEAGMQLQAYLEASDNCDFPAANVGKSNIITVTLDQPIRDPMRKADEGTAATDKKKAHDQKQDAKLERQNKEIQQRDAAQQQAEEAKRQETLEKIRKAQQEVDKEQNQQPGTGQTAPQPNAEPKGAPKPSPGEANTEGNPQPEKPDKRQPGQPMPKASDNQGTGEPMTGDSNPAAPKPNPMGGGAANSDNATNQQNPMAAPMPGQPKASTGNPGTTEKKNPTDTTQSPQSGEPKDKPKNQDGQGQNDGGASKKPPQSGNQHDSSPAAEPQPRGSGQSEGNAAGDKKGPPGAGEKQDPVTPMKTPSTSEPKAAPMQPGQNEGANKTPMKPMTGNTAGEPKQQPANANAGSGSEGQQGAPKSPMNSEPKPQPGTENPSAQGSSTDKGGPKEPKPQSNQGAQDNQEPKATTGQPQSGDTSSGSKKGPPQSGEPKAEGNKGGQQSGNKHDSSSAVNERAPAMEKKTGPKSARTSQGNGDDASAAKSPSETSSSQPGEPKANGQQGAAEPAPSGEPKKEPVGQRGTPDKPPDKGGSQQADSAKPMSATGEKGSQSGKPEAKHTPETAAAKGQGEQQPGATQEPTGSPKRPGGEDETASGQPKGQGQQPGQTSGSAGQPGTAKPDHVASEQRPAPGTRPEPKTPGAAPSDNGPKQPMTAGQKPMPETPGNAQKGTPMASTNSTGGDQQAPMPGAPQPGNSTTSGQGQTVGSTPGGQRVPGTSDPLHPNAPVSGTPAPEGTTPDAASSRQAGDLQLEKLKKIDPKVLEKLKMTEEEYRQFLKAMEAARKRKQKVDDEQLNAPIRGGTPAANSGLRRVEDATNGTGDLSRAGSALPPPEFREAQSDFTRRLGEPVRPPMK